MAAALAGMLMPLGGYKGSGLAMLIEILSGGAMSVQVSGLRTRGRPLRTNHTFLAIDVARFPPVEEFQARMEWLVREVKSSRPAAGYNEVLVAGDPEWRAEDECRRTGIPVPAGPWRELVRTAERLGVEVPRVGE